MLKDLADAKINIYIYYLYKANADSIRQPNNDLFNNDLFNISDMFPGDIKLSKFIRLLIRQVL